MALATFHGTGHLVKGHARQRFIDSSSVPSRTENAKTIV
jgi:hypothetical protein